MPLYFPNIVAQSTESAQKLSQNHKYVEFMKKYMFIFMYMTEMCNKLYTVIRKVSKTFLACHNG